MHSPAGRARQEQRGPETAFSLAALSQEQCRADCLPQEHLACWAICSCQNTVAGRGRGSVERRIVSVDLPQTQVSPLPQQVEDLAASVAIVNVSMEMWRETLDG